MNDSAIPWSVLSDLYAFLGNSLLKPMSQTASVGLDPAFWAELPDFGDASVRASLDRCVCVARAFADDGLEQAVEAVSVEYTRLFIGPPSPAAAPWETFYRNEDVTVGFGEATFQMRTLLREAGLELANENRQYEDHLGIELLYLSVLCGRIAQGRSVEIERVIAFIDEHPASWTHRLADRIAQTFPEGYCFCVVELIEKVLAWHLRALRTS